MQAPAQAPDGWTARPPGWPAGDSAPRPCSSHRSRGPAYRPSSEVTQTEVQISALPRTSRASLRCLNTPIQSGRALKHRPLLPEPSQGPGPRRWVLAPLPGPRQGRVAGQELAGSQVGCSWVPGTPHFPVESPAVDPSFPNLKIEAWST